MSPLSEVCRTCKERMFGKHLFDKPTLSYGLSLKGRSICEPVIDNEMWQSVPFWIQISNQIYFSSNVVNLSYPDSCVIQDNSTIWMLLLLMETLVALKRADWFGKMVWTQFTWSWCTWSQPWFPQRRRAWPALRAGGAWQQSGSPGRWWWTSCCSEPDG